MERLDSKLTDRALNQGDSQASEVSSPITQTIGSTDFALLWAKLCAAYPRQDTTSATAEVFFEQLSLYTQEQVSDAIDGVIATSKWFPSVAEIIEQIDGFQCPHKFAKAEVRLERDKLKSLRTMQEASEVYAEQNLKRIAEEYAETENKLKELASRSKELYERDRQMIEESGLLQARNKLDAINSQIQEQERTLTILKQKVKLFDQARILQTDEES